MLINQTSSQIFPFSWIALTIIHRSRWVVKNGLGLKVRKSTLWKQADLLSPCCKDHLESVKSYVKVFLACRRCFELLAAIQEERETSVFTIQTVLLTEGKRMFVFIPHFLNFSSPLQEDYLWIMTSVVTVYWLSPQVQLSKGTSEEGMDLSGIKQLLPTAFK